MLRVPEFPANPDIGQAQHGECCRSRENTKCFVGHVTNPSSLTTGCVRLRRAWGAVNYLVQSTGDLGHGTRTRRTRAGHAPALRALGASATPTRCVELLLVSAVIGMIPSRACLYSEWPAPFHNRALHTGRKSGKVCESNQVAASCPVSRSYEDDHRQAEYLEHRFGRPMRRFGAALFVARALPQTHLTPSTLRGKLLRPTSKASCRAAQTASIEKGF